MPCVSGLRALPGVHRVVYRTVYRQVVKTDHRRRLHCCLGFYESSGVCVRESWLGRGWVGGLGRPGPSILSVLFLQGGSSTLPSPHLALSSLGTQLPAPPSVWLTPVSPLPSLCAQRSLSRALPLSRCAWGLGVCVGLPACPVPVALLLPVSDVSLCSPACPLPPTP